MATPSPIAAGRPDATRMTPARPSRKKYTIIATHMKAMSSWIRSAREPWSVLTNP